MFVAKSGFGAPVKRVRLSLTRIGAGPSHTDSSCVGADRRASPRHFVRARGTRSPDLMTRVAMHSRKPELEQRHISVWQSVFDATYTSSSAAGAVDDYAGWTDSGGRQQIPDPDMREWADDAAASVSALRPGRLLEVGCGTGLLLRRLAHDCRYVGTDLSAAALTRAAAASDATVEGLHQLPAHEIDSLGGGFDAVVLNSVVQYFPGLDYLRDVLHQAVEAVAGTGHVFVGDVRHVDLLDAQAAAELDAGEGSPWTRSVCAIGCVPIGRATNWRYGQRCSRKSTRGSRMSECVPRRSTHAPLWHGSGTTSSSP